MEPDPIKLIIDQLQMDRIAAVDQIKKGIDVHRASLQEFAKQTVIAQRALDESRKATKIAGVSAFVAVLCALISLLPRFFGG